MLAEHPIIVVRRVADIRELKVHFVGHLLHGRQDKIVKAIPCIRAFGHDVGFERDFTVATVAIIDSGVIREGYLDDHKGDKQEEGGEDHHDAFVPAAE